MAQRIDTTSEHLPFSFTAGPDRALLIHGFMGSPKEMRPLGQALAEAGLSVRGVLLPGFGPDLTRLATVRATDWLRTADDTWHQVLAGATRTTLVGFSMGGAVALQLAARRPPDRLVLLAPHWRFADPRANALPLIKRLIKEFRPFERADFADPAVRQTFLDTDPDLDLDDPTVQTRLRRETVIPTATLDELRRVSYAASAAARRIDSPTLVLQGRADVTVLPHHTRRLAVRLRGPLTYHEVAAGHLLVATDHPAWPTVRDLVVRFATAEEGH